MRSEAGLQQLTEELLAAYDAGRLIERPTARGELDLSDAYRVGAALTALRRARGERTIGRKIGFTNRALWPAYGVDRPLWAHVDEGTVR